jgi:hypothetical protein
MTRLLCERIIPVLLLILAVALSITHIISDTLFMYFVMAAVVLSVVSPRMLDAVQRPWQK